MNGAEYIKKHHKMLIEEPNEQDKKNLLSKIIVPQERRNLYERFEAIVDEMNVPKEKIENLSMLFKEFTSKSVDDDKIKAWINASLAMYGD